jgi:hypothetical protein
LIFTEEQGGAVFPERHDTATGMANERDRIADRAREGVWARCAESVLGLADDRDQAFSAHSHKKRTAVAVLVAPLEFSQVPRSGLGLRNLRENAPEQKYNHHQQKTQAYYTTARQIIETVILRKLDDRTRKVEPSLTQAASGVTGPRRGQLKSN